MLLKNFLLPQKVSSFGYKVKSIMEKVEHIGIAVRNLAEANETFSRLLGQKPYKAEVVESEGVTTSFFRVGDVKIELLEASDENSPIARFIEKRGEGIHHLAFAVADIKDSVRKYAELGFEVINKEPKAGADNKLVVFLHPKTTGGVLVELCQERT